MFSLLTTFYTDNVDFEIWDTESGNLLFSTPDLRAALTWALEYWTRQGDEALSALAVGAENNQWVVAGQRLRAMLSDLLWPPQPQWTTSATSVLTRGRLALSI